MYSVIETKKPQQNTLNALKVAELSKIFDDFLETPNSPFFEGHCNGFLQFRLFSTLIPHEWLNDNVVTAYSVMLTHREKLLRRIDSNRIKILYIDSLIFSSITSPFNSKEKKSRIFIKQQIGEFDKVFFFANQTNTHWVLFEVFMKNQTIFFYDSWFHDNLVAKEQVNILIEFLNNNIPKSTTLDNNDWNVIVSNKCQFQTNNNDCGVFMLTFALFLADFAVESVEHIDCEKLARWKIALDITRGYIEDPRLIGQTLLTGK
jgi:Ulp1 family protease